MTEKTVALVFQKLRPMRTAILMAVLLAAGMTIYSNSFHAVMIFDDHHFIIDNLPVHMTELSWDSIKTAALKGVPANRYLPKISWAINFYFGKLNPFGYHLVNLIIHLLSGIFLFLFIKNTLSIYSGDIQDTNPELIAFFSALIWIVQPVGTQAVTYICQRMASMVALFYILSLLFYVKGRTAKRQMPSNWKKACLYFSGFLISFICAMATKENAGTMPLILLLYEWFFFQDLKVNRSRSQILWIIFFGIVFAIGMFWFMGENPMLRIMNSYKTRGFTLAERVMTEWRIMIYYISLFVWAPPGRLNLDHHYPLSLSFIHPATTMLALGAILSLLALAAYTAKKHRLIAFCILWFFVVQATESTFIGIELIFEHRTYIPFMMTSLFFVLAIFRFVKNRPMAYILLVATALVFSIWTYQRNQTWQHPVSFWADCVSKSPDKCRPVFDLGVALHEAGDISGAIVQFEKYLKMNTNHADAYNQKTLLSRPSNAEVMCIIGDLFLKTGKPDKALDYYSKAMVLNPSDSECYNGFGNVFFSKQLFKQAREKFEIAVSLNPKFYEAYYKLGLIASKQGKMNDALMNYKKAIRVNPDYGPAHKSLADILFSQGDLLRAAEHYSIALKLNPNDAKTHYNLGVIRFQQKKFKAAETHFYKAVQLDNTYEKAKIALPMTKNILKSVNIGKENSQNE